MSVSVQFRQILPQTDLHSTPLHSFCPVAFTQSKFSYSITAFLVLEKLIFKKSDIHISFTFSIYWGERVSALRWLYIQRNSPGSCLELSNFVQFSSVQLSRSVVSDSETPWTAARHASLSITNSQSLLKLMSIESVMPFNHLTLCHPLLLPPSILPSIRVFSNESVLRIRQPKYWSFSLSISPSNEYSRLISFRMDWLDLFAVQGSSPTPQFNSINSSALSFLYSPTLTFIQFSA